MKTPDMKPTKNQSPMPTPRALWLAAVLPFLALIAQAQSVLNISADFASIQDAISAAQPGDTLVMTAGTFAPSGTIVLDKDGLVLRGAGADETTIDVSGFDGYGILISADHVRLQNFAVAGNGNGANSNFAIKTSVGISDARLFQVHVMGSSRTAIDFNGVTGGVISGCNVTGTASGYGVGIASSMNITLKNLTTLGNAYGNVGIFPAQTQYQGTVEAPTNIRFLDSLNLEGGVITVQPGALLSGGVWDPVISTVDATDVLYSGVADVKVPEPMHYTAQAVRLFDGLDNRVVGTPEDVLAVMALIESSGAFGPQAFTDLETGDTTAYIVGCMDSESCTYDMTATVDDESACVYPDAGYNCEGEIPGCMDENALNYNADATVSEPCIYLPAGCIPVFEPAIQDTVRVDCVDLLPNPDSIPLVSAYDPCNEDNAIPVISSLEAANLETACGQFVTYRHLALNIEVGVINVQYQTYMVDDTTGPAITSLPEGLVLSCELAADSANWGAVEAVDSCHDLMDISYTMDSMYVDTLNFPVCEGNWLIARSVSVSDVCGNASAASYVVTVRDLLPPTLGNVPASDSLSCVDQLPMSLPLHADECSGSLLTLTETTVEGDCPQEYTLTRTFVATDGCGNAASAEQVVVVEDTLAPMILTTPPNLIVDCGEMAMDSAITAMDQCSDLMLSTMDSTVLGECPQEYTILRTHSATDACGNVAQHVQTIELVDNEAPLFTDLPAFVEADCADVDVALASAYDSCGMATVTFATFAAFTEGIAGDQIRLYTAMDECGNAAQGLQMVDFGTDPACAGCTDSLAVNYDPAATLDDGSCNYAGLYDLTGNCVNDADGDGVCDEIEIVGCQDSLACKYVSIATDAGDCDYPMDPTRDCNGMCISDADGDGVCDGAEVVGCLDPTACNFSAFATDSNPALCDYACYGCTYGDALNYDAAATRDDGNCAFPQGDASATCEGDANGDGEIGIEDLLDVLANFAETCD